MIRRLWPLVTLLCLLVPAAQGATYYVDAASGNDSHAGTSEASAWKTLVRANSQKFSPGDTLLLRRGCAWSGQLAPEGSGSSEHGITVDAYGKGGRPVINGDGKVDSALALDNQSYWTIKNLEITNKAAEPAVRSGVLIQAINAVSTGITLQGLVVHNVCGISAWGRDKWANAGIRFNLWQDPATRPPACFRQVIVKGCAVQDVREIGLMMLSNSTTKNSDIVVSGNRVDRTGADGIILQDCAGPRIVGNVVYHCGQLANDFQYIAGVWTGNCSDTLMQRNEVAYTKVPVVNGHIFYGDSQAFDLDVGETGSPCIQYNYSHNNGGGFLLVMGGSRTDKITIRYNISVNDGHTNCGLNTTFNLQRGPVYLYNNVFYDRLGQGIVMNDTADTHYENNIFASNGPCQYGKLPQYSNNCYFSHVPTVADSRKVLADPQFVTPGSDASGFATCNGYRLKKTSPCLAKGLAIQAEGGRDFFSNTLSPRQCDIGAYELPAK